MRLISAVLPLSLALVAGLAAPLQAQTLSPVPLAADATVLSVSTSAQASATPDIARISAGVVTQAADSNNALRQNATRMAAVLAAVKAAGISASDVQTGAITLNPQYRYAENEPAVITGYQASNSINLKVRDLARLGQVLDALAAQGANQIDGPSFAIDKPEPLYQQARIDALASARAQADTYASQLGLRVRRVVSLSEAGHGGGMPVPVMAMRASSKAEMMDTPVAAGESQVSVNLDVVFELGR